MTREPLLPAEGVDAFVRAPIGTYLSGATWIYACVDARLFVQIYAGRPEPDDVAPLMAAWQVELAPMTAPHASLVDASRLEGMRPEWFALMGSEMQRNAETLAKHIERQAFVRPSGVAGALVAGFPDVIAAPYPTAMFTETGSALVWLGRADERDADAETINALIALSMSTSTAVVPALGALRRHLHAGVLDVTLATAARALGTSARSLQRHLSTANTSFEKELTKARVERAQTLMTDSELNLTAIALEVGCTSLSTFSELFRRHTGETPTAWRASRRPR